MAKKNKTAADIYREEMSDATQPKSVVEGSRPLDNIKITPEENLNGLADPYKDQFAVSLPKSNEIDYGNVNNLVDNYRRESMNNLFDEKKDAPVIHDDVPIIDTTVVNELPTEEMIQFEQEKKEEEKMKSDLAFMDEYWKNLYTDADREADEKRKKAAKWITAAQMLGDTIAALSNVYWTGKGANAQKFEPGAQKAAAATYQLEQDIRNAREKAAKAQYDATLEKYKMELQRKKDEQTQANLQKTFDANEAHRAQQQKNFETTEARLAEQARLNAENEKIRIDIARQNANIQLKNALDKNKPYPMAVNGEIYEIPIKKVNEQIIGSIFAKLPEEVRMSAGQPIYDTDLGGNPIIKGYKNPSLSDMLAAIGTYGNEDTAKEIMKLAGVTVEEEGETKVVTDNENSKPKVDFVGFYEQQNNVAPWATSKAPWQQ